MDKLKNCAVDLVADTKQEVEKWIEQIKNIFENVTHAEIREIDWSGHENIDVDFRCRIYFTSTESKIKIYKKMNQIKANPIKFIS